MKSLTLLFLLVTVSAQAKTFNCVETDYSREEYGYNGTISITINNELGTMDFATYGEDHGTKGTAYLNKKFKSETDVIYLDPKADLCSSDIEASAFLSKSLLLGKPGKMVITGGQPNEGETGPTIIYYTAGIFDCK
jgi:hypothetical protein